MSVIELYGWAAVGEAAFGLIVLPIALALASIIYLAILEWAGLGRLMERVWTAFCLALATFQIVLGMAVRHPETLIIPVAFWTPLVYDRVWPRAETAGGWREHGGEP